MTPVAYLESVAQQLAARIRDDEPEAVARWLQAMLPDPADWFRLCFVLAAAHPEDRGWVELTSWAYGDGGEDTEVRVALRRRALTQSLAPRRAA